MAENGVKEYFDNPIVFLILIAIAVTAFQLFGRWIGQTTNSNGVSLFFGGPGTEGNKNG